MAPRRPPIASATSPRALNRALLARQHLITRSTAPFTAMIEHLVGLQAQMPNPPYLALWARVSGFQLADLTRALEARQIVRGALMRSTLHVVTADDFLVLRAVLQPVLERLHRGNYGRALAGLDLTEIAQEGRRLFDAHGSLTTGELGERLQARWPGPDARALANTVRNLVPLVHVPPAGTWSSHKHAGLTPPEAWLGRGLEPLTEAAFDRIVRRYLAAFGPATARDVQAWSGLTGVTAALARLRPGLLTFTGDEGQLYFDVPEAPRPAADTPVPPVFLPDFDQILLAHADRRRIMTDADKARVFTSNGIIRATILVDGVVWGMWRVARSAGLATLEIEPFGRISRADRAALREEGTRLLGFVTPDESVDRAVRFL